MKKNEIQTGAEYAVLTGYVPQEVRQGFKLPTRERTSRYKVLEVLSLKNDIHSQSSWSHTVRYFAAATLKRINLEYDGDFLADKENRVRFDGNGSPVLVRKQDGSLGFVSTSDVLMDWATFDEKRTEQDEREQSAAVVRAKAEDRMTELVDRFRAAGVENPEGCVSRVWMRYANRHSTAEVKINLDALFALLDGREV
jgi:hypothetical protein